MTETRSRAAPASCCTRPACPARSASATSARPPTPGSTPWPAPGRRGGRSSRSARPGTATPRTSRSPTFAGNLNLISPELLVRDGLLRPEDLGRALVPGRPGRLRRPSSRSSSASSAGPGRTSGTGGPPHLRDAVRRVPGTRSRPGSTTTPCSWRSRRPAGGQPWYDWPADAACTREPAALADARRRAGRRGRPAPVRPVPVLPPVARPAARTPASAASG